MARSTDIADLIPASIDASDLAHLVSERIVSAHRERIARGEKADGTGPQPPGGSPDGIRGYRTGHLANGIRARVVNADEGKATTLIEPPSDRISFLRSEAEQGIHYLRIGSEGTPLSEDIDHILGDYLVRLLEQPDHSD